MASQKHFFGLSEKFYLVKITTYNFSACLKTSIFRLSKKQMKWPIIETEQNYEKYEKYFDLFPLKDLHCEVDVIRIHRTID